MLGSGIVSKCSCSWDLGHLEEQALQLLLIQAPAYWAITLGLEIDRSSSHLFTVSSQNGSHVYAWRSGVRLANPSLQRASGNRRQLEGSGAHQEVQRSEVDPTQGLQCSSFLVMTYFLLGDYSILPKIDQI